ncbi:MAG: AAA family ATPase, partial [Cyanobacteria bacterium J06643_5]
LYFDSGIPVACVNSPLPERMNVLEEIYIECAQIRDIPLYVWNAGWGCFKKVKYNSHSIRSFINPQPKYRDIFISFDSLLNNEKNGIFIFENLSSLISIDSPQMVSYLINIYFEFKNSNKLKYLVILSTDDVELPEALTNLIPSIYYPLPGNEEITNLIETFLCDSLEKLSKESLISA